MAALWKCGLPPYPSPHPHPPLPPLLPCSAYSPSRSPIQVGGTVGSIRTGSRGWQVGIVTSIRMNQPLHTHPTHSPAHYYISPRSGTQEKKCRGGTTFFLICEILFFFFLVKMNNLSENMRIQNLGCEGQLSLSSDGHRDKHTDLAYVQKPHVLPEILLPE